MARSTASGGALPSSIVLDPARLAALDSLAVLDTPTEKGFDDAVRLAARLCATPVALVSLVSADRQWFKARVGFPPCETDLNSSVCAYALAEPDLLVIPDLTADPRTSANPLVTAEPFIRFYAGAPLRLADGLVVGSLCVIDTEPRPEGLTSEQADDLRALGRQVSDLLEMRRLLHARDEAAAQERRLAGALGRSQERNRLLFDTIDAGFCVIEVKFEHRGNTAVPVDYRFLEVNPAFERQTGLVNAAGKWMRDLAPAHEQHWFDIYGRVALSGEPARFENGAAALGRWYDVHAIRVGEPEERHVALLFNDISARRRAEVALRESESRFRALVSAGAQSIYRMSPDWLEMRNLDGMGVLADTDAPSVRWLDLYIAPADHPIVLAAIDDAIGRKGMFELEHRVVQADGSIGWTLSRAVPIFDEAGQIVEWFGAATDVGDRRAAQEALRASEAHWRGLFERLSEGFIVGEVTRDAAGRITDWRYVEVNRAWGELVGVDARSAAGRTIREVFPGIEDQWVDEFAQVVRTGEPVTFTRQVGTIARWYEGRAFRLDHDQFGVIFLEVTERVKAEARQAALLELGVVLSDARTASDITRATCRIVGESIGAIRVGFGSLTGDGQFVDIEPDWTIGGVASLAGRHRFDDYGKLREDLVEGSLLAISDVTADPRTASDPLPLLNIGIGSMVNVPVRERGRTVALLYVHDANVRAWAPEELAFFQTVADRLQTAIARVRAEEQRDILNHELSHRLKNSLAMVLSIATQTLRTVTDRGPIEAFEQRIHALSTAHDVLLQQEWNAAPLDAVAHAVLGTFAQADRLKVEGPAVPLGPRASLSVSLLLHELATNAAKYGALSNDSGCVSVRWRLDREDGEDTLILDWVESGGPPVKAPARRGFGSRLIRLGLVGSGAVDLQYPEAGFQAEMRAPLSQVQQS